MILVVLEIENYKQFAGAHRIEPAANGTVGVLGPNGVGKTTLFEAIEWCLYNPREISTEEVRSRGGTGHTRVRVTLEDPRDGARYVVERVRKGKAISADLYREDQPENRIVTGTRQVTEYVARQLIGLSHRAFVSTFFTRQKELSFFGGLTGTDRRREVGRLLGLETIREAQGRISDARREARNDANGLLHQYRELSEGRDFAAERGGAEQELGARKADLEAATTQVGVAGTALIRAGQDLERWHELERCDNEFALALERLTGEERTQGVERDRARDELGRMDAAETTRAALAPVASDIEARVGVVEAFAGERTRFERQQRLHGELKRAEQAAAVATQRLRATVERTPSGPEIPATWAWLPEDARDPIAGAERLLGVAASLDVAGAQRAAKGLESCLKLVEVREKQRKRTESFGERLQERRDQEAAILAEGDPHPAAAVARQRREVALATVQTAAANRRSEVAARRRLQQSIAALQGFDFATPCPTCQRPFTPDEADAVLRTLTTAVAEHEAAEARQALDEREAAAAADIAGKQADAAEERVRKLEDARSRLRQGEPMVEEAERDLVLAIHVCLDEFSRHGLEREPTEAEAAAASDRAGRLLAVASTIPTIEQTRSDLLTWAQDRAGAEEGLGELGDVAYDPAGHERAQTALDEARQVGARIAEIDRMLARRPEVSAALATAGAHLTQLMSERTGLEAERAALGFQPAGLETAKAAQRAAVEAERQAIGRQHLAQGLVGDAEKRLRDLESEEARLTRIAERAALRQREADDLDRMYREFSRFDQWVAEQVTPQLAEHTGELLGAVTEGKYDRVEFDENYGLRIFDEDEAFPIDSFSGGERDVAALCARLALSRIVGGQSGHPPEFLVLDEVFGSLDRDRRTQVLEMLGTLAASTEAFRQLFIISHVDDVRASAVFNQVWRVAETESGGSRFEDITTGGGLEEI